MIFDDFSNDFTVNRDVYGSNGMGLWACKKLLEKMGGKIWLESSFGSGSDFYFSLPLLTPTPEPLPPEKLPEQEKVLNILVAEDDPPCRLLLQTIFEQAGHKVNLTDNGLAAVTYFTNHREDIDLIILDIKLPYLDGLDVAGKIREINAHDGTHTPIVAVTADALPGDREKCLAAGMDAYIAKPFRISVINKVIEKFC